MGDEAQRFRNRMSVKNVGGVQLAGLDGVNQKVPLATSSKSLLINAIKTKGCVKLVVQGHTLVGSSVKTPGVTEWGPKLDEMAKMLTVGEPCYFVLFRSETDCLIVTYVPDDAKPFSKMLYSTSKESVKDAVTAFDPEMQLEEFNVAKVEELSWTKYQEKHSAPKPYSQIELDRMEQEAQPTGGSYGALARIIAMQNGGGASTNRDVMAGDASAKPMALPGMAGGGRGMMGAIASVRLKPINEKRIKKKSAKNPTDATAKPKPSTKKSAGFVSTVKPEEPKEVKPVEKIAEGPWNDELEMEIEYDLTKEAEIAQKALTFDDEALLAPTEVTTKPPPSPENVSAPVQPQQSEQTQAKASNAGSQVLNNVAIGKPKKPGLFERISRIFRGKKTPKLTLDEIRALPDEDGTHTIAELREIKANGEYGELNPATLESCLSSKEFGTLFSMTKENFYKLKPKKQANLKKKLGL